MCAKKAEIASPLEVVKHKVTLLHSHKEDILDKYQIDLESPIPELSTQYAKYYKAHSLEMSMDGEEEDFFAIICEKEFYPNIDLIDQLKQASSTHFATVVSYGVTKISSDDIDHFIVIIRAYDHTVTLENNLKKNGDIDTHTITHKLIPCIVELLEFCVQNKVCCGNINPSSIVIIDGHFFVREFFAAPQNALQPKMYLAPEIADCNDFGRETSAILADIYALGMLVYVAATNNAQALDGMSSDIFFNALRIEHGTYHMITSMQQRIPSAITGFLKGTLADIPDNRWKLSDVVYFNLGKQVLPKTIKKEVVNHSVLFGKDNYTTPLSLASAMYHNWNESVSFVTGDVFIKWIQRNNTGASDDSIGQIVALRPDKQGSTVFHGMQEYLFKVMTAVDGKYNIRTSTFCISIESIASALKHAMVHNKRPLLEGIIDVLTKKWWQRVVALKHHNQELSGYFEYILSVVGSYDSASNVPATGIERMVYTLNPYMPCQSQILVNHYVVTLQDFLSSMNEEAANPERVIIDRHMIGFLCSRVPHVRHESDLYIQKDAILLSQTLVCQFMVLLQKAHNACQSVQIDNIIKMLGGKLSEIIEKHLHNVKLAEVIADRIHDAASEGNLSQMISIMSNSKVFQNDRAGYRKACLDVATLNKKIVTLNETSTLKEFGVLLGQRITVFGSYIICLFVALILVM